MSHKLIIKEIKSKKFQPVYFLHGEEPYFIDAICDAVINNCLQEEEKGFNQTIIYGKSAEPKMLINELKSFPMMGSEHRLVVLCLLYTSPSPRDVEESRMPSSA